MVNEPESQTEKPAERQPPTPARPGVIIRVFRALKRYENRRRRNAKEYAAQHPIYERMMARWTRRVGLFTGALVLVSLITAGIFKYQLDEMHEAGVDTRRLAIAAERANRPYIWLTLEREQPSLYQNKGGTYQIIWPWRIQNYGKTPVLMVKIKDFIEIDGKNFVESPGGEGFSTPIPIPPNGTSYSAAISLPGLRPEDFQNWLKADHMLGLKILVQYSDAYGEDYEANICLERLATSAFGYCGTGNAIK